MTLELGLSDAGLVVPRTADYLTEIRDSYAALSGIAVDWDSDLVLGILTAIMAQLLGQQAEGLQAVYDSFDVNNAAGVQLANLASLVGVGRKSATAGQVTLTLTGTVGTVIGEGKQAEGGGADGRARWALSESVVIGAGGTADVVAVAVVPGRTIALAGEIDTIVTPVPGWDAVTNAANATPGTDDEKDPALRARRRQSIQLSAGLGIGAIRAKLLALDFIEAAAVIDNPDNESRVVQGISMLAHSYLPVLLPNPLTLDQIDTVHRLLYDSTPLSTRSSATDEVALVVGDDGFEKSVGFDYATDLAISFVATLTMAPGYSMIDAGEILRGLVEDYVATLSIGDDLRSLPLLALAATVPGILGASFLINGVEDLEVSAVERAVYSTWSAVAA